MTAPRMLLLAAGSACVDADPCEPSLLSRAGRRCLTDSKSCRPFADARADPRSECFDLRRAADLYATVCPDGLPIACRRRGEIYAAKKLVWANWLRARSAFGEGCGMGDAPSCEQADELDAIPARHLVIVPTPPADEDGVVFPTRSQWARGHAPAATPGPEPAEKMPSKGR